MILCPECNTQIDGMCYDCGCFYETPTYEVHDLYNYNKIQPVCYQKITHFREVLNNFQGRECKTIPHNIIMLIKHEINDNMRYVNHLVVRSLLKKHRFTKYVENVNSILFILTGQQPPFIPKEVEVKLIKYFKQIVNVFDECKTTSRVNFLNYYYVLYKLLEVMSQDDLMQHVPRMKSKHRVLEHDKIWKRICNTLNWQFVKTRVMKASDPKRH